MGLNWHQGVVGASKGLGTVMDVNQNQINMLYQEVSAANRERFRSAENASDRAWRTEEAEKNRTVTREGQQLQHERNVLAQESLDTWRQIQNEQGQLRLDIEADRNRRRDEQAESQEGRLNADQVLEKYKPEIEALDEKIKEVSAQTTRLLATDEQQAQAAQQLQSLEQQREELTRARDEEMEYVRLPAQSRASYDDARDALGETSRTHELAMDYAGMSDEERAQVPTVAEQLQQQNPEVFRNRRSSIAGAIDQIKGRGGEMKKAAFPLRRENPTPPSSQLDSGQDFFPEGPPQMEDNSGEIPQIVDQGRERAANRKQRKAIEEYEKSRSTM